jgi:ankyrin repeat protein
MKGENCVLQLKCYLRLFQADRDVRPLYTAADVGNKEIVKLLLINGINPNIQSENVFFDIWT